MNFRLPDRYGEVMVPLDWARLPDWLNAMMNADKDVRIWIALADEVQRAEKVSSPLDWTTLQRIAYRNGDWALFSRLRGYTDAEISVFARYMALSEVLMARYGEDEIAAASAVLQDLTMTFDATQVNAWLRQRMEA